MAGLATGAEIVVTPERGSLTVEKMQGIADRLKKLLTSGHDYGIVLVAEGVHPEPNSGVGPGQTLAAYLQTEFHKSEGFFSNIEVRASVLGHLQRGGSPLAADRLLAAQFAEAVGEAMMSRSESGVLGLTGGQLELRPFTPPDGRNRAQRRLQLYELHKSISRPQLLAIQ
jgi:6-phosphofructokinase 1